MNRILQQLFRMFLNRGINAGIDKAAGSGKSHKDMTPEERAAAKAARETAKRARQAIRMGRRIGRF
jgi:hypothetical protein